MKIPDDMFPVPGVPSNTHIRDGAAKDCQNPLFDFYFAFGVINFQIP